jgi:hypothetical protein
MKRTRLILGVLVSLVQWQAACAEFDRADVAATCSVSGQFLAHAPRPGMPSRFAPISAQKPELQPALLVIACERVKQALNRKLGAVDAWEGQIHLHPRPARSRDEAGCIVVDRPLTRLVYRADVPDCLDQERLTLLIVQAVLLEMANRGAVTHSAEIPPWLVRGLTEELLAASSAELILPGMEHRTEFGMNLSRTIAEGLRQDPLARAQQTLRTVAPLTFEQLSWPGETVQSEQGAAAFRSSAQLFVNRLLALPDGPPRLRGMISALPKRLNWQFAFLQAFEPHFKTQLDVEKWWALQVVQFTGRDMMQTYTLDESCRKLIGTLRTPIEVRGMANDLPQQREATLQEVIRDWSALAQQQFLQRKITELDLLRLRVAQGAVAAVDEYRAVLSDYVEAGASGSFVLPFRRSPAAQPSRAALDAIRRLDILDARLVELRLQSEHLDSTQIP